MEANPLLAYEEVREKVRSFILENFLFGEATRLPSDEESLLQTGVIDSTGILELINFVEQEFGIVVQDNETLPENLDGIGNISRFVRAKVSDHDHRA